ncbi:GGDEF domain-containing protein [Lysobacter claricitrinus]|uniref:GGDEF domain-containing protein n=1 Tax=Lysobacter claricitrinus TaxID=3367728 RepID=UPI0038B35D0E
MGAMVQRLVLAAALLALPALACASSYGARLKEAETVRTSDPRAFLHLLDGLEADKAQATPSELRQLRLLHDYQKIIFGEYQAAIGDAAALFDQAPEVDVKFRAGLLVTTASALNRDFSLGLRYLDRALSLQSRVTDPELRATGHGVAAVLFNQLGQYDLGLRQASALLASKPTGRAACYGRQIWLESAQGLGRQLDEATEIQPAISECAAAKQPIGTNGVRTILAKRWASSGHRSQAIALLEASLPEAEGTGYSRLIGEIKSLLAQYRLEQGNLAQAETFASAVQAMKGQDPMWLPGVTAHHVLYEVAIKRGDLAAALEQYRAYAEADKARLDEIKAREYAFQLSRHELNQKNQSIALLKSQNQLLLLQQKATRASAWNTRLAIALLLVLVASVGYWGWRARRTHGSLRTLAETDGLTGLANRRHFRQRSEAALALCAQRKRPACVLLFDLDHFKQINDQCGHSSGDWVLREVARVGRLHCREQDLFGRIGGEEFAMTLVDCDGEAAMRTAEACRRAIDAIDASIGGCGQPVAASIGVVSTAVSGYEYETLIAHADAAMYRSKVAGRNRVTLYERPPVPQPGVAPAIDRRNAEAMLKQY